MFRTIIINFGEQLSIKDNWLVIESADGINRIPIGDIYSVVIDNQRASISIPAIHALTASKVHILVCNEKHLPVSVILPQDTHFRPLTVIRKQIGLTDTFKDKLWDKVIAAKIRNQATVLKLRNGPHAVIDRMLELSNEVVEGDIGNREGIAAKMFFRNLYGTAFIRMNDDAINAALNYGYAIIRAAIAKTLCAYGYNCVLDIHHINETNPFNLADDMMEPLRPIVDLWVDSNSEDLSEELTKQQRASIIGLVNENCLVANKRMKIRNAIDVYIRSLTTCINNMTEDELLIPQIIAFAAYNEVDEGEGDA